MGNAAANNNGKTGERSMSPSLEHSSLAGYRIYLKPGVTDMRKSTYTLLGMVCDTMGKDPYGKSMFVFCGKRRNTIKMIVWDNGFWMFQKTIEAGTFAWPKDSGEVREIGPDDFGRLLEGQDIFRRIPVMESAKF